MALFLGYDESNKQKRGQVAGEIDHLAHAMAGIGLLNAMGHRPVEELYDECDDQQADERGDEFLHRGVGQPLTKGV